MNTENYNYVRNGHYLTVNQGKDCWYIRDNYEKVIGCYMSKKSADEWLREKGYKLTQYQ